MPGLQERAAAVVSAAVAGSLLLSSGTALGSGEGRVEVLHWWTAGGEARAVDTLKGLLADEGYTWVDFAVTGGIDNAMEVLSSRVRSGNPPAAAQILAASIGDWARYDMFADLSQVAEQENWDGVLPENLQHFYQYNGEYVAVPLNIHRTNWMWYDPEIFAEAGAEVPTTWEEFLSAAERIEDAGYLPLAVGDQAWQQSLIFQGLVASEMTPAEYDRAFAEMDPAALSSEPVVRAFERLGELKEFAASPDAGSDWDEATLAVIRGRAAMQIMGDWAKSEFIGAGQEPGRGFGCTPVPGTTDDYVYSVDSLVMFDIEDPVDREAQMTTAALLLRDEFQTEFNLEKGSIPVRTDLTDPRFDECAERSRQDLLAGEESDNLTVAFSMVMPGSVEGQVNDVVGDFFHDAYTPQEAADALAEIGRSL